MPDYQFRQFWARPPWWGGALQTIRNHLLAPPAPLIGQRLEIPLRDGSGDCLVAALNWPETTLSGGHALAILCHGLGGDEESPYMLHTARYFLSQGWLVARLNFRGAGPSGAVSRHHYHAGRSQDFIDAFGFLQQTLTLDRIYPIGFSISGNTLIKALGELGEDAPQLGIVKAAAVSAPLDLHATSAYFHRPGAALYHRNILQSFRTQCMRENASNSEEEKYILRNASCFFELDNAFVAPKSGFKDARDYYEQCQAAAFLHRVAVPLLILQAGDDPVVPCQFHHAFTWASNRFLLCCLTNTGGHLGFHSTEGIWYLPVVDRFFQQE